MEKPFVIGVDMGGTNTVFGIVDGRGQIVARSSIRTQQYSAIDDYMEALYDAMMPIVDTAGGMELIRGIGAGAPNANYYTGNIEQASNLPWKEVVPFTKLLTEKFGIPARVTNDANAAAMGEMTYGVARGMKNFIMITLGTGIGSGIVVDGKVVYGYDGYAGELGHTTIVREGGRLCGCGKRGCLEAYASCTGVARTAREWLQTTDRDSLLRQMDTYSITSKTVYDAALNGDVLAKDIFEYTGRILGEKFADFIAFSAPEAIILFGGLTKAGDFIFEPIRKYMDLNVLPRWRGCVKLLFSGLKESDVAVLGASALAWNL